MCTDSMRSLSCSWALQRVRLCDDMAEYSKITSLLLQSCQWPNMHFPGFTGQGLHHRTRWAIAPRSLFNVFDQVGHNSEVPKSEEPECSPKESILRDGGVRFLCRVGSPKAVVPANGRNTKSAPATWNLETAVLCSTHLPLFKSGTGEGVLPTLMTSAI